uniref:Tudor domain-containing protein 1 n=1 Tax=Amphiprion percula TaxID=161767 RepID=A0A3P8TKQ9_AMPPE
HHFCGRNSFTALNTSITDMNRLFSPNLVRPNQPLRKPSSSPVAAFTASPPRHLSISRGTPVRPASGAIGHGKKHIKLFSCFPSQLLGSVPPALTVHFCNYCGQQGNFRCTRCKKMPYCSVVCQTEDWKAHRHVCKSLDAQLAKKILMLIYVCLCFLKHNDSSSSQRVYWKDLHTNKINKGGDFQACVVEFYSPGRFFLIAQNPEMLKALQSIAKQLQKAYSSPSVTTYAPCVGEVCAVQFSCDLNWYRGLVQTLTEDQKMAYILYIDFGNEENVPVDRIRPLAANIQPFCPCAMECRIAGVVPVGSKWSSESCIATSQLIVGKTVTVRLVETQEDGRIHAVDILLSMGKRLSTFLIEHGYAQEEMVIAPTEQDINALVSASLANFRRLSLGKDDNTWAEPPEPLTQAVGDKLSVVITHFQSPDEFIVQKVENAGVIQDLQLKLREHCSQVAAPHNFRPAPGTVCCAQFSEDKQWYRAKVMAYSSEERVCVGYLDFGNSEEVDLGHLRRISTSLLALPMQAMPCGLAGVRPVAERWSEDCLVALQRRVSNRILHIEIQGAHEGKALVAMIDETSDPQANVAELLISAGYAAPAPAPQADETTTSAEPNVSPPVTEPLVWSSIELPCDGQTVALLASVVENPGDFYCQIANPADHQQLINLGAELKQHCEADTLPFVPKVGQPCCDGAWYRAMVKGLCEDKVAVNFVDYGYSMTVEKGNLRSITPQLLTLPFQAVHCWLTGVEPQGLEWSSEALLWFQTQVEAKQLSARVLSVTEQGYGVELESRGQNVAAALISEHLAKVPGEAAKETQTETLSGNKQESVKKNEHHQLQTDASFKEITERQTAAPAEVPSFPVDWKTVELPLNEPFQPYVAAVISPSLFYLLCPTQDQQKLQQVMMELHTYCSNNQATLSSVVKSRPAPGAACCAQFSDNNWYRAVVLEVGENDMSVIYADYGNSEKVPFSRILPVPMHLLQLPFQITRCTLAGKELFPPEWPKEIQQMFQTTLLGDVIATVHSFDGSANVLHVTPTEKGGELTTMILDALHSHTKSKPCPAASQKIDKADSSTSVSTTATPDCPEPKEALEMQKEQESSTGPVKTTGPSQTSETSFFLSRLPQIDHLEQLMEMQLSLIKQLVGQKK